MRGKRLHRGGNAVSLHGRASGQSGGVTSGCGGSVGGMGMGGSAAGPLMTRAPPNKSSAACITEWGVI